MSIAVQKALVFLSYRLIYAIAIYCEQEKENTNCMK